jgi:hypothetical protein
LPNSTVTRTSPKIVGALASAALWLFALAPSAADAQVQHLTGPYETENGIKVGEGRLHPYFDFEMHYDSAAGFFDTTGGTSSLKPELIAHFRPGLRLEVPMSMSAVSLDGNVDYLWYTGLLTQGSSSASRLQAAADATAQVNQGGAVEFDFGDHFARSDRTTNVATGIGVLSLFNDAHIHLPIRPGGRALEIVPNAGFSFETFKAISSVIPPNCDVGDINCDPAAVNKMNYQNFRFGLDARWKFLPKTAFTFENRVDTRSYSDASVNPSAFLLKSALGIAGLISPKVATVIKLGWAQDFKTTSSHAFIALAELSYLMSETSNFKIGYLRTMEPVPTYGTYRDDRGYLEARFFLNGRLTLHGAFAFDAVSFFPTATLAARSDKAVTLDLGPEYQFAKWFIGAAGYILSTRSSNLPSDSYNFTRNEAYVRATFIY